MPTVYSVWRQICYGWICMCMRGKQGPFLSPPHPHDDCVTGALRTSNRSINLSRSNGAVRLKSTRNKVVTSVAVLSRRQVNEGVEATPASHVHHLYVLYGNIFPVEEQHHVRWVGFGVRNEPFSLSIRNCFGWEWGMLYTRSFPSDHSPLFVYLLRYRPHLSWAAGGDWDYSQICMCSCSWTGVWLWLLCF